jgi:hypothetical protein
MNFVLSLLIYAFYDFNMISFSFFENAGAYDHLVIM